MMYFKDSTQITVFFENGSFGVWKATSSYYNKVCELAKKQDWIPIEVLHNQAKTLLNNNVLIKEDEGVSVKIKDKWIELEETPLTKFIQILINKGTIESEIEHIKPFLTNMFNNPYIDAVEEVYQYCKAQDFEITEDGCLLAYKNVNKDFSSIYDQGTTKHAIGEVTEVTEFDTDRRKDCSQGLHFCSKSYLPNYTGAKTIVVKVNPKDIVSIPMDYNFAKGRCRKYIMVGIIGSNGKLVTNLATATNEKVVTKTEIAKAKPVDRIQATYNWYIQLNKDHPTMTTNTIYDNISKYMNISKETVSRNLRKYKTRILNESTSI